MSRRILKPWTWFPPNRVRLARALIAALNARDYATLSAMLTEKCAFLDTVGSPVTGRAAIVEAMREIYRIAPDLMIEADELFEQDGEVLVRGRLNSANADLRSESLWRIGFDGGRVRELQAYRENNTMSVTRMTAHLRSGAPAP